MALTRRRWSAASLHAQAARKQLFPPVLPLLSVGGTHPKTETRPAGKERTAIADAIKELQARSRGG